MKYKVISRKYAAQLIRKGDAVHGGFDIEMDQTGNRHAGVCSKYHLIKRFDGGADSYYQEPKIIAALKEEK